MVAYSRAGAMYLSYRYLEQKIAMGESQSISCPAYGCYKLVPLVSPCDDLDVHCC